MYSSWESLTLAILLKLMVYVEFLINVERARKSKSDVH